MHCTVCLACNAHGIIHHHHPPCTIVNFRGVSLHNVHQLIRSFGKFLSEPFLYINNPLLSVLFFRQFFRHPRALLCLQQQVSFLLYPWSVNSSEVVGMMSGWPWSENRWDWHALCTRLWTRLFVSWEISHLIFEGKNEQTLLRNFWWANVEQKWQLPHQSRFGFVRVVCGENG